MKCLKLHIRKLSNPDLIDMDMNNYTNAFMLLYKMLDMAADNDFIIRFKERFNLTDIGYRSLVSEVKSARTQDITNNNERIDRINDLTKTLKDTELDKRYLIYRKISELKRRLGKERTFGGIHKLREITREYNKPIPDIGRLDRLKKEYRDARVKGVFLMGEANQKGNRFFDLSCLHHGKCLYKPRKGESCEIHFKVANKKDLERISKYTEIKELSVSVHLTDKYICFVFDEQQLNGFGLDEKSRREKVREIKSVGYTKETESEKIKRAYMECYDEQRERMMRGKIESRCMSVDLNPTNIGWSVLDKTSDGECKIVACGWYGYDWLCRKLHKKKFITGTETFEQQTKI